MKIADTHMLPIKKTDQHGLTELGWQPNSDNAKRRFSLCDYPKKIILINCPLSNENPEEKLLNTIPHEIAFALALIKGGADCGYGDRLKAVCRKIGGQPRSSYGGEDVKLREASWALGHLETGEVFSSFTYMPKTKDFSNVWNRASKREALGKLKLRKGKSDEFKSFS